MIKQADVGVDCSSDAHQRVEKLAYFTAIMIGIGVPAVSWFQMRTFYKAKEMHTDRCKKRCVTPVNR